MSRPGQTVGSGIGPDLLTLRWSAQALAGSWMPRPQDVDRTYRRWGIPPRPEDVTNCGCRRTGGAHSSTGVLAAGRADLEHLGALTFPDVRRCGQNADRPA